MTSKMMGHQMQRYDISVRSTTCAERKMFTKNIPYENLAPRAGAWKTRTATRRRVFLVSWAASRARDVYRNTSKKSSKVAMMRGMSARRPSAPQPTSATTSFPPPAPAPRQGLFSSLFRKSQAPLEDQDLEE